VHWHFTRVGVGGGVPCQMVANQPHDEEVNLSDDSSPEVRSPRPSPVP
jgi:hypothetical protein